MAKRKSQSIPDHVIQLSPIQYAHFTEGEGLFIKSPEGETLAFIHEEGLEGHAPELLPVLESIDDAAHQLDFLSLALSPGDYLELSPDVQLGLQSIMHSLRGRLKAPKL